VRSNPARITIRLVFRMSKEKAETEKSHQRIKEKLQQVEKFSLRQKSYFMSKILLYVKKFSYVKKFFVTSSKTHRICHLNFFCLFDVRM
jgi:hypothetical protein